MARGIKINGTQWDLAHYRRIQGYAALVDEIFRKAAKEAARIGAGLTVNPDKPFSFAQFPQTQQRINDLFNRMARDMNIVMANGQKTEWLESAKKNDAFVDYIFRNTNINKSRIAGYYQRNLEALAAFQKRKVKGLALSDRVWKYTRQFKNEIELGLDIGLGEGRPAAELARDLQQYLQNPDKLFRRVRDKYGNLQLSKAAKAYHPGQGIYRSSYKNALRLTRTETNMSYRMSDHERWTQLDFVRGIEVRLSGSHPMPDICDDLKGFYPKSFIFRGWHAQCLCFAVPVLLTSEEFNQFQRMTLKGEDVSKFKSSQDIKTVPRGFVDWIDGNKDRVRNWKSQPFFIKDNFKRGRIENGLRIVAEPATAPKISFIPDALEQYEKERGISINKDLFTYLKKPVPLTSKSGGAYYYNNSVNVPFTQTRYNNHYAGQKVIYHEYGHAIDDQFNLALAEPVSQLMNKYRKKYRSNKQWGSINQELWQRNKKYLGDVARKEMTVATMDALMSLNTAYGAGHTKSYFKNYLAKEKEFIAHAFENKFLGNEVFKEVMPDLYEDMIKLTDELLKIVRQKQQNP